MLRETPTRRHADYSFIQGKVYLPRETKALRSAIPTLLIVSTIAVVTIIIFIKAWPA